MTTKEKVSAAGAHIKTLSEHANPSPTTQALTLLHSALSDVVNSAPKTVKPAKPAKRSK